MWTSATFTYAPSGLSRLVGQRVRAHFAQELVFEEPEGLLDRLWPLDEFVLEDVDAGFVLLAPVWVGEMHGREEELKAPPAWINLDLIAAIEPLDDDA